MTYPPAHPYARPWLWALLWALLTLGCAPLQNPAYLHDAMLQTAEPTVTTAQGTLGKSAGKSVLMAHWKNSYADTKTLAALEEIATSKPLIAGNTVTLLYDGPKTMAAMEKAIAAAKDHINLETYIFDQDAVGMRFAELLMERQRAGVQVHVIYDAVGTISTPQAFFDQMREAGIQLLAFNPINPLRLLGPWTPNQRDHRKILVVDGRVAFTGGINISSTYANSSLFRSKNRRNKQVGWRDTHVQIEGPAVAALQWEFVNTWAQQTRQPLANRNFFPPLQPAGPQLVRVVASESDGDQEIYKSYLLAITTAKTSVHITSAYFIPDAPLLQALCDAARRGVDVKLILPGVQESGLAFFAGNASYSTLLASGVRIFQLQDAVLHAKTAVIDGMWSTVGSANIDTRSFLHNQELNVVVFDSAFGRLMESAFEEDMRLSIEITPEAWAQRPHGDRLKEWMARRLAYWL